MLKAWEVTKGVGVFTGYTVVYVLQGVVTGVAGGIGLAFIDAKDYYNEIAS